MSKTVGGFPSPLLMMSTPREVRPAFESEAIRIGTLTAGGGLALYGLIRGGWLGLGATIAGGLLIRESGRLARQPYTRRWYDACAAVTILATPHELHGHWHPRSLADTLAIVADVELRGEGIARILLNAPHGPLLPWDVVIEADEPGQRVKFRSAEGSLVPGHGEIQFRRAPGDRGTELHARIRLGPPASLVGAIAAGEIGDTGEPGASLADDLRRLKQRVEAGETATISGQPRGAGRRHLRRVAARILPPPLVDADTVLEAP